MSEGQKVRAGWYPHDAGGEWVRWWDGAQWKDAYWRVEHHPKPYQPNKPRLNVSTTGKDWYHLDVVGENYREKAIADAIGGMPPRDNEVEWYGIAELVPEPDNPFDRDAISVRVNSAVVGYLDADSARDYKPVIHALAGSGVVPAANVRIWAVTRYSQQRSRDELKSAVRLNLRDPDSILPANKAPSMPHALIPRGRAIQITGESDHLSAIAPHIGYGDSAKLVATLHRMEVPKARTTTTVVEVRLDGERVGQLTPGTSASLFPLLEEAETRGRTAAAWASVKGSRFAAEVTLHVERAENVPDEWPSPDDAVPIVKSGAVAPHAFQPEVQVSQPPKAGLTGARWLLAVAVILLIASIPAVGPILMLVAIAGLVYWAIRAKKQPPKGAQTSTS